MILKIILIIIFVLLAIAFFRTLRIKKENDASFIPEIDEIKSKKIGEKLSKLIQIETINEIGMSKELLNDKFKKFRDELEIQFPNIHSKLDKKIIDNSLLYHWKGKDSSKDVMVLLAHSDVVTANGQWKYPAFDGIIAEGKVWGRGAMDNKGALTCLLESVESLLKEDFIPETDIYIVSSNNEETMGLGAKKIADYLVENNIKLGIVLDEGGAVVEKPLPGLEGKYAMVGILEKGYGDIKFTAKSKGGHSSTPPKDNPIARLAKFINHIEKSSPFKKELTKPVRDMFENLAPYMEFPMRFVFVNLWLFGPLLKLLLPKLNYMGDAMLKTTCVFTMIEGSDAPNVIPNTASVVGNLRYMIHQRESESIKAIEKVAKEYELEMEVLKSFDCSPAVDMETDNFKYVNSIISNTFPEAGVSAYVMMGGTDAKYFANICPCTVRFSPLILSPQQLSSMHAVDENINLDALYRGVEFYRDLIINYK